MMSRHLHRRQLLFSKNKILQNKICLLEKQHKYDVQMLMMLVKLKTLKIVKNIAKSANLNLSEKSEGSNQ